MCSCADSGKDTFVSKDAVNCDEVTCADGTDPTLSEDATIVMHHHQNLLAYIFNGWRNGYFIPTTDEPKGDWYTWDPVFEIESGGRQTGPGAGQNVAGHQVVRCIETVGWWTAESPKRSTLPTRTQEIWKRRLLFTTVTK